MNLNSLHKLRPYNRHSLFASRLPTFSFKECLGSYLCDNMGKWYSACGSRASCSSLALAEWLGFYMVLIKLFLLCLASSRVRRALIIWTLPGKCKGAPEMLRKWTKSVRILAFLQHGACQIEHPPRLKGEDRVSINKTLKSDHNITVWKYGVMIKLSFNTEWFCILKIDAHVRNNSMQI